MPAVTWFTVWIMITAFDSSSGSQIFGFLLFPTLSIPLIRRTQWLTLPMLIIERQILLSPVRSSTETSSNDASGIAIGTFATTTVTTGTVSSSSATTTQATVVDTIFSTETVSQLTQPSSVNSSLSSATARTSSSELCSYPPSQAWKKS